MKSAASLTLLPDGALYFSFARSCMIRVGGQSGTAMVIVMSLLQAALAPSRPAVVPSATASPMIPDDRMMLFLSGHVLLARTEPSGPRLSNGSRAAPLSR